VTEADVTEPDLPRRLAGRVIAIDPAGRVLLFYYEDPPPKGVHWATPGGGIEDGEDFYTAACRELAEETGADAGPLRFLGVVRHGYSHFTVELHVYRGSARRPPRLGRDRRWASRAEIARLPLPRATEKVLALLGGTGAARRDRASVSDAGAARTGA